MRRIIRRPKKTSESKQSLNTQKGNIHYLLKRSSARRTLCITIDEKAQVEVAAPFNARHHDIEAFIHEKAKWIVAKIKEAQINKNILDQKSFSDGQEFLFLGKRCRLRIKYDDVKRTRIDFNGLSWHVTVPRGLPKKKEEAMIKAKLIQWYRKQAEEILGGRIFHYSRIMNKIPRKIAIRTQKRVWGNCDYNTQTIHLNWQIILSPLRVVDYIVVHEMCHLFVPNHSRRFWNLVGKYMPDFDKYKKWLKVNSLDMVLP